MNLFEELSESTIKSICEYVNGDAESSIFNYRTGSQLVELLKQKFHVPDIVAGPTRWTLTQRAMEWLCVFNDLDSFFTTLFSIKNMNKEHPEEDDMVCASMVERGILYINKLLRKDDYELIKVKDEIRMIKIDSTLLFLGEGGFSKVYRITGTNLVRKKLKDEFKTSRGVVSRFKNEFEIVMTTLRDMPGIIKAFDYDPMGISYTMEYCEMDLYNYINDNSLTDESKYNLIVELLQIMCRVHDLNVLHRDLSPKNIFVKGRHLVLADFGLGKDLNRLRSHQTYDTAYQGTLDYCDPRQIRNLSDGDKKSDIYSLGRLINFIMTRSPHDYNHTYAIPCTVATNENANNRYNTVNDLLDKVISVNQRNKDEEYTSSCLSRLRLGVYSEEMDDYVLSLSFMDLVYRMSSKNFRTVYKKVIVKEQYYVRLEEVLNQTHEDMRNQFSVSFSYLDGFGYLMLDIIKDPNHFNHNIKIAAANNLYYIASYFNRYSIQDAVKTAYNRSSEGNEYLYELYNELNK